MPGTRTFIRDLIVALLCGLVFAQLADAQSAHFPLQPGNVWTYRLAGRWFDRMQTIELRIVEVVREDTFGGRQYFLVHFFGRDAWLRASGEKILAYQPQEQSERTWIDFGAPEKETFETALQPCNRTARVEQRDSKHSGPLGEFTNVLLIAFDPSCADAGITHQRWVAGLGLIEHEETSIAGPQRYELVHARVGLQEFNTGELSFNVSLDSPVYGPGAQEMFVRLRLSNSTGRPVRLVFPSGQSYDVAIRNEKGERVYVWSAGKAFPAIFRTEDFAGERNYAVAVPLSGLAPGKYVAEAWLTTEGPRKYAVSAPLEIRGR
ncbi:MAG: hypothetical protein HYS04_15855 [Acidobacteria bacterium]|nr:hypothetical protein [Acidobacteriota bacterium]